MTSACWKMILVLLFLVFPVFPMQAVSEQSNDPLNSHGLSTQSVRNVLVEKMMAHDLAFSRIVSAVALGDSDKVLQATLSMHGTMDKTLEGVRAGTITLPKNSPRIADFIDMDLKFRTKLEALDRAARHHNQREMQRIVSLLLSGCVKCHHTFGN